MEKIREIIERHRKVVGIQPAGLAGFTEICMEWAPENTKDKYRYLYIDTERKRIYGEKFARLTDSEKSELALCMGRGYEYAEDELWDTFIESFYENRDRIYRIIDGMINEDIVMLYPYINQDRAVVELYSKGKLAKMEFIWDKRMLCSSNIGEVFQDYETAGRYIKGILY